MIDKFIIKKNPNKEDYDEISEAVTANDGYCPCMSIKSEDTKCMCHSFRISDRADYCHCGRYFKVPDLEVVALLGTTDEHTEYFEYWEELLSKQNFIIIPIKYDRHNLYHHSEGYTDLSKTKVDEKDLYEGISYTETLNNTLVTIKNLKVEEIYTTNNGGDSDGAMTLTCKDSSGNTVKVRTGVLTDNEGNLVVESDLLNQNISITGIVEVYNESYQVKVLSYKDIIVA